CSTDHPIRTGYAYPSQGRLTHEQETVEVALRLWLGEFRFAAPASVRRTRLIRHNGAIRLEGIAQWVLPEDVPCEQDNADGGDHGDKGSAEGSSHADFTISPAGTNSNT